jgi:hypothetical protein
VIASWIPFIGAVIAAVVAGRYALRAKTAEFQANRVLELERRLAASKADVFEPMVEALGRVFELTAQGKSADEDAFEEAAGPQFRRFVHWVQVYGADETVLTVHKMMQAFYSSPPSEVVLRLMGELLVAARRELGHPDTKIDALDLMGIRINELSWEPPWGHRFSPASGVGVAKRAS